MLFASARQGYLEAQIEAAECYQFGRSVEQNDTEAFKWYRLAAEQGDAYSLYYLGLAYREGIGVAQDQETAFGYFKRSLEEFVKHGTDSEAIQAIGDCYLQGLGVEKDIEKAVSFYREYAEVGFPAAQFQLALGYYNGQYLAQDPEEHVVQDYKEAVKWFKIVAEAKSDTSWEWSISESQFLLGMCYRNGTGVERDFDKALKWFQAAAERGHDEALFEISWGDRDWGEADPQENIDWIRSGLEQGSSAAMNALALCYCLGDGVEEDVEAAIKLWRQSAEQGNLEAMGELRGIYKDGFFVEKNLKESEKWSKKIEESKAKVNKEEQTEK